jgi:hypothetical protein
MSDNMACYRSLLEQPSILKPRKNYGTAAVATLTSGAPTAIARPAAAFTSSGFANVRWLQVELPASRVDTVAPPATKVPVGVATS